MTAPLSVKPIHSDDDYEAALEEIDRLWDAEPGTPEHDLLEVLAIVIDDYETKRWPIDPPDPIDAIKSAMERRRLTRKDLEPLIGSRARVSEILNRRRHLTLPMVWRLHRELGIPAESLVQPYELERPGGRRGRGGRSAAA